MPLILVVEQEQRYVERIAEALSSQGWNVEGVKDRSGAMERVAEEAASLVVISSEVPEAARLVQSFARSNGGPGAVILVPEDDDNGARELGADEILKKPFTDQDIRLAVRRCVSDGAGDSGIGLEAPPLEAEPAPVQFTSEDIFGDVVSELESSFGRGDQASAPAEPAPPVEEPAEEPVEEPVEEPIEKPVEETVEEAVAEAPEAVEEEIAEAVEAIEEVAKEVEEPVEEEIEQVIEEAPVEVAAVDEAVDEDVAEPAGDLEMLKQMAGDEALEDELEKHVEPQPQAEEEPEAEVEEPEPEVEKVDPAAILDQRLRQAAEEGKRAASTPTTKSSGIDSRTATDSLIMKALSGLDVQEEVEAVDSPEETAKEVDAMIDTMTGKRSDYLDSSEPEPIEDEIFDMPVPEEEEAVLEVVEGSIDEGDGTGRGEYQTRLKLVWVIIAIVILGFLGFLLARQLRDRDTAGGTFPSSSTAVEAPAPEVEGAPADQTPSMSEASGTETADSEEQLRRELDAQRRQLQEEIVESQRGSDEGNGDDS